MIQLKEAEKFGAGDIRRAATLDNLARAMRRLGAYAEAASLYGNSLVIKEKTKGLTSPELEDTLFELADLRRIEGNFFEAERLYKRGLAIKLPLPLRMESFRLGLSTCPTICQQRTQARIALLPEITDLQYSTTANSSYRLM